MQTYGGLDSPEFAKVNLGRLNRAGGTNPITGELANVGEGGVGGSRLGLGWRWSRWRRLGGFDDRGRGAIFAGEVDGFEKVPITPGALAFAALVKDTACDTTENLLNHDPGALDFLSESGCIKAVGAL